MQMSDLGDLARSVNKRHHKLLAAKDPRYQTPQCLPPGEVEIFRCLGLIKEVSVCKKVLIEFLTKFILDNV